jgi:predicted amidophosphoribosyltransferase
MLRHLFRCSGCGESAPERLPLCAVCAESLIPCPELCPVCGSPICGQGDCLRPWAPLGPLESLHAAYLFIGQGHEVLKAWKFKPGPLLDRRVLRMEGPLKERLRSLELRAIVTMPQRFERSFQLKGSPSFRIAQWVSRELDLPVMPLLRLDGAPSVRQTGSAADARFGNRARFKAVRKPDGPILLVDDFMTTGHTLRKAALALGGHGLHAFCLGLRLRGLKQKRNHLGESMRGAVAIGQA